MSANATFKQLLEGISEIQNQKAQEAKITSAIQGAVENPASMTAFLNLMQVAPEAGKGLLAKQQMQAQQEAQNLQQLIKYQEQQQAIQQERNKDIAQRIRMVDRANSLIDVYDKFADKTDLKNIEAGSKFIWRTEDWKNFIEEVRPFLNQTLEMANIFGDKDLAEVIKHQIKNLEGGDRSIAQQIIPLMERFRERIAAEQQSLDATVSNPLLSPDEVAIQQYIMGRAQKKKPYNQHNPLSGTTEGTEDIRGAIINGLAAAPSQEPPAASEDQIPDTVPSQQKEVAQTAPQDFFAESEEADKFFLDKWLMGKDLDLLKHKDFIIQGLREGSLTDLSARKKETKHRGKQAVRDVATPFLGVAFRQALGKLNPLIALEIANGIGSVAQGLGISDLKKNIDKYSPYLQQQLGISEKDVTDLMRTQEGLALLAAARRQGRARGDFGEKAKASELMSKLGSKLPTLSGIMRKAGDKLLPGTKQKEELFMYGATLGAAGGQIARAFTSGGLKAGAKQLASKGIKAGFAQTGGKGVEEIVSFIGKEYGLDPDYAELIGAIAGGLTSNAIMSKDAMSSKAQAVTTKNRDAFTHIKNEAERIAERSEGLVSIPNQVEPLEFSTKHNLQLRDKYKVPTTRLDLLTSEGVDELIRGNNRYLSTANKVGKYYEGNKDSTLKIMKRGMENYGSEGIKGKTNQELNKLKTQLYREASSNADKRIPIQKENLQNFVHEIAEMEKKGIFSGISGGDPMDPVIAKSGTVMSKQIEKLGVTKDLLASLEKPAVFKELSKTQVRRIKGRNLTEGDVINSVHDLATQKVNLRKILSDFNSDTSKKIQAREMLTAIEDYEKLLIDTFLPNDTRVPFVRAQKLHAESLSRQSIQKFYQEAQKQQLSPKFVDNALNNWEDLALDFGAKYDAASVNQIKDSLLLMKHTNNVLRAVDVPDPLKLNLQASVITGFEGSARSTAAKAINYFLEKMGSEDPFLPLNPGKSLNMLEDPTAFVRQLPPYPPRLSADRIREEEEKRRKKVRRARK